ncbi:MAG TPA: hypothetical protein VJJ76_00875 [archaeon]|nr:hypothetical protein [archaeon]
MTFLKQFFSTLSERLKKKIFLLALVFTIFYFFFQLLYPLAAKFLNDSYYIDKAAHFSFGYVLFSFWYFFMQSVKISKLNSLFSAFLFVLFAALAKEFLDFFFVSGIFSLSDLATNFSGIVLFSLADWRR